MSEATFLRLIGSGLLCWAVNASGFTFTQTLCFLIGIIALIEGMRS